MARPKPSATDGAGALALTRTTAALRSAARIARLGGWEVDVVTQQTFFSPELCELLGAPSMPPIPIAEANLFWLEPDRAPFLAAVEHATRQGERLAFEGRSLGPDGAMHWWRLLGEPEFADGRCIALRGAAQDITEWREALERETAAVRAADEMSGFLATMSHEIRTPLNGVLGMAQVMGRNKLSADQRERLGVIETSGEALLSLLNDLLDLSKIEAGKIELEDGIVDAEQLAAGVRVFSELVREKDVRLEVTLAPEARGCWAGDPHRIRQILHNLVSNAVKFTQEGAITVQIGRVGGRLTLRVQDTGIGIAPGRIASVFDRFVQADASTTRRYGGSGLGLTIARDLAALMGGALTIESVAGVGTTCTVGLPLAPAAMEARAPLAEEVRTPTPGLRVLAAEDNETNQMVLKSLLGAVGIEPVIVANGREALDAWRAEPWDIVLMDIQMPVMDGLAATWLIRADERRGGRPRTPIIALTANAMAHQRASYLAAGVDEMVAKPISIAALMRTMDALLPSDGAEDDGPAETAQEAHSRSPTDAGRRTHTGDAHPT
jgi:signal transduction histidine kinase/DNA-binding NarL/FixJ family response regulator